MKNLHPALKKILDECKFSSHDLSKINEEYCKLEEQISNLRKQNDIRDEYWASISHEMRTPLQSILAAQELLKNTQLDNDQKNLLNIVQNSGQALLAVINDVLDLSKLEANKVTLNNSIFDLDRLIKDIIDILSLRIKDHPIEFLYYYLPDAKYYFIGDIVRIRQILLNIIGNAVKFTKQGHILIHVNDLEILDQKKLALRITIEDTGIGIQKDKLNLVFKKFTQCEKSVSSNFSGTGLGLYISKHLTNLMNGDIEVQSEKGKGSKFTINLTLPFIENNLVNIDNELINEDLNLKCSNCSSLLIEKKYDYDFSNINILIAEDIKVTKMLLNSFLSKSKAKIQFASNGIEALKLYKENKFDMIFMDCNMPEQDGYETAKIIRKIDLENNQHTIIIALTASIFEKDKKKCLEAGMDDYICKPFKKETIFHMINKYKSLDFKKLY